MAGRVGTLSVLEMRGRILRREDVLLEQRALLQKMGYLCATCMCMCGAKDISQKDGFTAATVDCSGYPEMSPIIGSRLSCDKYNAVKAELVH